LYIHSAAILTPSQTIAEGAVLIEADRFAEVGPKAQVKPPRDARVMDAAGLWLAPGFIDLQLNGAFGHDFTTAPDTLWDVAARLPHYGVAAFLPTIVTSPPQAIAEAQAVLRGGAPPGFVGAAPLGLHLEGPFLNPEKRGAHNPAHLRLPAPDAIADWSPQRGMRLVTLAPELPGALEAARTLAERGVVVGAGHSTANYAQARAGLEAGIRYGTHLFNAMPPMDHRAPGLAGALLADARATVGLIPDGIHLHPSVVTLAWKAKGPQLVNLVTDAIAALGMPPGRYRVGDFEVSTDGVSARLADGRLAGSVLSLDQAVRNLIAFAGCSLAEAVSTVTTTPAALLGLSSERGQIAPGFIADLALLASDLHVAATVVRGQVAYRRRLMADRE
jgi:N-acetylglucosamine-6-phosphate deacetylase